MLIESKRAASNSGSLRLAYTSPQTWWSYLEADEGQLALLGQGSETKFSRPESMKIQKGHMKRKTAAGESALSLSLSHTEDLDGGRGEEKTRKNKVLRKIQTIKHIMEHL